MADSDITYRWLTQRELDEMLDKARREGAASMREAIAQELDCVFTGVWDGCEAADNAAHVRDMPIPEAK
jgi:hypothetical protein